MQDKNSTEKQCESVFGELLSLGNSGNLTTIIKLLELKHDIVLEDLTKETALQKKESVIGFFQDLCSATMNGVRIDGEIYKVDGDLQYLQYVRDMANGGLSGVNAMETAEGYSERQSQFLAIAQKYLAPYAEEIQILEESSELQDEKALEY